MPEDDGDDEYVFEGLYENGSWEWDERTQALLFICDRPSKPKVIIPIQAKTPTGTVKFQDDVDLIEQLRYRRRYQRKLKPGQADLVTLQDIKDLVLFTAPVCILSRNLIRMLHLPTIDRFLRALIFCCAYYLQITDEMSVRISQLSSKLRTSNCDRIENEFQDNLADLRLLVAKEYCIILIGGADTKKYHHLGYSKMQKSLSDSDARLFESFVRISIQIVWIALGRKKFHLIELETHRILKTDLFNPVKHRLKSEYMHEMPAAERATLLGRCVRRDRKPKMRSPLMNDVFCHRPIDYRLLGLGVVNYPQLSTRLKYFRMVVAGTEETLVASGYTLGIIGLPRSHFDTMLRPLPPPCDLKSKSSMSLQSLHSSKGSVKKSQPLFSPIMIPSKDLNDVYDPPLFPVEIEQVNPINELQLKRWLRRLKKLMCHSLRHHNYYF